MVDIFIINILVIFGVKALFSDGMLLSRLKYRLFNLRSEKLFKTPYLALDEIEKERVRFIFKPLFQCPPCMASVWGMPGFLLTGYEWYYLPIYLLALCGAVYLIVNFMPG